MRGQWAVMWHTRFGMGLCDLIPWWELCDTGPEAWTLANKVRTERNWKGMPVLGTVVVVAVEGVR